MHWPSKRERLPILHLTPITLLIRSLLMVFRFLSITTTTYQYLCRLPKLKLIILNCRGMMLLYRMMRMRKFFWLFMTTSSSVSLAKRQEKRNTYSLKLRKRPLQFLIKLTQVLTFLRWLRSTLSTIPQILWGAI